MKYASVNGKKTEAFKGGKGVCCFCKSEMIAHCGDRVIHHWKHKSKKNCDHWWENEKEWHRQWKNNFPKEWQEVIVPNKETGELHIADVRAFDGTVVEFQHSRISPEERKSREQFYKYITWIVDGTRLKRDFNRFLKSRKYLRPTDKEKIYKISDPEEHFPKDWVNSQVPVIFDFLGMDSVASKLNPKYPLYCLMPNLGAGYIVIEISRSAFIKSIRSGTWYSKFVHFLDIELLNHVIKKKTAKVYSNIERLLKNRKGTPNRMKWNKKRKL